MTFLYVFLKIKHDDIGYGFSFNGFRIMINYKFWIIN